MHNVLRSLGAVDLYKEDPDMPDEALTAEYVCDKVWVVGSPETVTEKLRTLYHDVGGFGTVLQLQYVYEPWAAWFRNMALLAHAAMPNLAALGHEYEPPAPAPTHPPTRRVRPGA